MSTMYFVINLFVYFLIFFVFMILELVGESMFVDAGLILFMYNTSS